MAQSTKINTKSLPAMITCECGEILNRMTVQDAFGVSVKCDQCDRILNPSKLAYHCSNQHCYCLQCSGSLLLNVNNKGLMKPIKCTCEKIMILTLPNEVYDCAAAHCNNTKCQMRIGKMEYCYHCPAGKSSVHPKGFDYCMKCARHKSMFQFAWSQSHSLKEATQSVARTKIENEVLTNNSMDEETLGQMDTVSHDYVLLRDAILENIEILCTCDAQLILTKPNIAYEGNAECDLCQDQIDKFAICFDCPNGKTNAHPLGFDVCLHCAIGNKQQHKKYKKLMQKKCQKLNQYQAIIKPEILTVFEQNGKTIRKNAELVTQIMPYMMDVQQVVFNQVMKRINGEEEIPGIEEEKNEEEDENGSTDSSACDESVPLLQEHMDEMKTLTLKQLHDMRNILNECIVKHEEVKTDINQLLESINCKINDIESEWESWNSEDIVNWIILLENGRYIKYEHTLRKELYDGDASGKILAALDLSDWRKSFEITNWDDAITLNKYKNALVANKRAEPVHVHEYPSPFDPGEEGADTK